MDDEQNEEQVPFLERASLSCSDVEDLLDCYIDGEMINALKQRFDDHLANCELCRGLAHDTHHLVSVARTLNKEPISDDIRTRLRKVLKDKVGYNVTPLRPHLTLVK